MAKVKKIGTPGVDPERSRAMKGNSNASKGGARIGAASTALLGIVGSAGAGAYVAARKSEKAVSRQRKASTAVGALGGGLATGLVAGTAAYKVTGSASGALAAGAFYGGVGGVIGGAANNVASRIGARISRPKKKTK